MPHVPSQDIGRRNVLTFADALAGYQAVRERTFDVSRWLYVPDFYTEYRYVLGTKGKHPLIAIGINPSTAEPDNLDNTLKSVERIALGNGYDSFIMFNIYAQRATDPKDMESDFNAVMHRENMAAFDYVLSLSEQPSVWAAWGTIIKTRPYLQRCMNDMIALGRKHQAKWFTCGARSVHGGHPHHPLYLRKDAVLDPFDPISYLND